MFYGSAGCLKMRLLGINSTNFLDVWQTTAWSIHELYGQIIPLFKDDKELLEGFRDFLVHNYPDGKKSLFHNAHDVGEFHAVHFSFTF
jgi:hypothetical protein